MSNVATYRHHKRCLGCDHLRPKTEFHWKSAERLGTPGLAAQCKSCRAADARRRRAEDPDFAERSREYNRASYARTRGAS